MDRALKHNIKNDAENNEAQDAPDKTPVAHRNVVELCMCRLLRVSLKDGRVIEGRLDCYDKQGNMILINAMDVTRENDKPHGRVFRLGTVMVPGGFTTKVLLRRQEDRKSAKAGKVAPNIGTKEEARLESVAQGISTLRIDDKQTAENSRSNTT
ncbi:hypothetical protein BWQ96_03148 [Gracilariopsis chorda]|uniref:Sm domain-containing protein n=1 Tax=Gracilariopsis chorda TaxID=448386 RepID=A0A2V3IY77_9FLOR|nr:hypothetical protein BWQ96_03148 [Gracilariopsis chorda]|eukprot:PXF47071.1 hypothetical protein BWQ96_03148 [Gracilariopsis chorda]